MVAWLARRVESALSELDVSLPQYRVLILLELEPDGASVVADELAVTRPTVTAIIDGLVARGLVDRSPDATDRRRVRLRMTAEGRAILAKADAAAEGKLHELLGNLATSAEKKSAINGLDSWHRALTS